MPKIECNEKVTESNNIISYFYQNTILSMKKYIAKRAATMFGVLLITFTNHNNACWLQHGYNSKTRSSVSS